MVLLPQELQQPWMTLRRHTTKLELTSHSKLIFSVPKNSPCIPFLLNFQVKNNGRDFSRNHHFLPLPFLISFSPHMFSSFFRCYPLHASNLFCPNPSRFIVFRLAIVAWSTRYGLLRAAPVTRLENDRSWLTATLMEEDTFENKGKKFNLVIYLIFSPLMLLQHLLSCEVSVNSAA